MSTSKWSWEEFEKATSIQCGAMIFAGFRGNGKRRGECPGLPKVVDYDVDGRSTGKRKFATHCTHQVGEHEVCCACKNVIVGEYDEYDKTNRVGMPIGLYSVVILDLNGTFKKIDEELGILKDS